MRRFAFQLELLTVCLVYIFHKLIQEEQLIVPKFFRFQLLSEKQQNTPTKKKLLKLGNVTLMRRYDMNPQFSHCEKCAG